MRTVTSGDGWTGQPDPFLAGGINHCGDWGMAPARGNSPLLPSIIHGGRDATVADVVAHLDARPANRHRHLP